MMAQILTDGVEDKHGSQSAADGVGVDAIGVQSSLDIVIKVVP
jgi:hypothetical protein